MSLEALIFDVDGTLAETEELHRRAFNHAFADHGLDWEWDRALYADLLQTTGGKERILHYIEACRLEPTARDKVADLHAAKTRAYVEALAKGELVLRPGVARLIVEARKRGLKLGIATTTTPANVEALLTSTLGEEALGWFTISAGDVPGGKKPDPAVYLDALAKLGIGADTAIAFEDSRNGVHAARAAGIVTVATPSLYLAGEDLSGAAAIVSDLGEPGAPMTPIAGWRFPRGSVDVDGLRAMLEGLANARSA